MRNRSFAGLVALAVVGASQAQAPSIAPPSAQRSLAATLNVYAFPSAGQAPSQQSIDESACYDWAVQNSGVDPFKVAHEAYLARQQADQQVQQANTATQGSAAKGALRGALAGVAIGAIAGDAGKGAAIGAGTGLVAGGASASGRREQAAHQSAQQKAAAARQEAMQQDSFKKAFGACLEGKKYTVKY